MPTLFAGTVTCVPIGPPALTQVAPPSVEYWKFWVEKSIPAVAMPLAAVRSRTIGADDGLLRLNVKSAGPPSAAVALLIVTVGAGSSSTIVPTPGLIAVTVPEMAAPERLNVSSGSSMLSGNEDVRTRMPLALAGTVTCVPFGPVALIQVAPPSVLYWKFFAV